MDDLKEGDMEISETNLIGDVKHNCFDGEYYTPILHQFLIELEQLMIKYQIQKIDIGWHKDFKTTPQEG